MKNIFASLALLALLSTFILGALIIAQPLQLPQFILLFMLFMNLTISFTIAYFFEKNHVKSRILKTVIYLVAFLPLTIPFLSIFGQIAFADYKSEFSAFIVFQVGFAILSITLFFKHRKPDLTGIFAGLAALICFAKGILMITQTSFLASLFYTEITALIISFLFLISVLLRYWKR